jgi:hypothetical protein
MSIVSIGCDGMVEWSMNGTVGWDCVTGYILYVHCRLHYGEVRHRTTKTSPEILHFRAIVEMSILAMRIVPKALRRIKAQMSWQMKIRKQWPCEQND